MRWTGPVVAAVSLVVVMHAPTAWPDYETAQRAYEKGDYATAYRETLPLAQKGDKRSQYTLGVLYETGKGVGRDDVEAAKWFLRAAEQGFAPAQKAMGVMYHEGRGVPRDYAEAIKWYQRAADQGFPAAQNNLGVMYEHGWGVQKEITKALHWYHRAAVQENSTAEHNLGRLYAGGKGVPQDNVESVKWLRRAAEHGSALAQEMLGQAYETGQGIPQDLLLAHIWYNLAASSLPTSKRAAAVSSRERVERKLTQAEISAARQVARDWKQGQPLPAAAILKVASTATGFVVSLTGRVLTNFHAVRDCEEVRVTFGSGERAITSVVAADATNDLATLQLPTTPPTVAVFRDGRTVRQGDAVVAIGFPLRGLLAAGAIVTTGTISALAGINNDARHLQVTAPVQPGNSGGPLLDDSGNIIGVVVGKLDAVGLAVSTGDIPQNVNFAIKASVARLFLDANGVQYKTAASTQKLEAADIAQHARKFTVGLECWK